MTNVDPKFLDLTIGNVITWIILIFGGGAAWQRLKGRQEKSDEKNELIRQEVNRHMDAQDKVLEEIKSLGSPASRTAIMVLNTKVADQNANNISRFENQHQRIAELEKVARSVEAIATDVGWIKNHIQKTFK